MNRFVNNQSREPEYQAWLKWRGTAEGDEATEPYNLKHSSPEEIQRMLYARLRNAFYAGVKWARGLMKPNEETPQPKVD